MESLGSFLKRGRLEAGITLEQLAERTRIRPESLEFLEQGDLENLPSDAYVRGFVKLVCRELGLPARDGIVRYEALRKQVGPLDEITWAEDRTVQATGRLRRALEDPERVVRRARRAARVAILAGGAVVAMLLAWGGVMLVGRTGKGGDRAEAPAPVAEETADPNPAGEAGSPPTAEEAPPPEPEPAPELARSQGPPELPLPLEEVQLSTEDPARIVPGRILVTVRPAGSEEADAAEAVDEPVELARAERTDRADAGTERPVDPAEVETERAAPAGRETAPVRTPPSAVDPSPAVADPAPPTRSVPRPVAGARLELEIVAVRAVEVQVLLDGIGYPRVAKLAAGERKRWKADSLFTVSASDGGAIRLRLAGEDLGSPGPDFAVLDRLVIRGDR